MRYPATFCVFIIPLLIAVFYHQVTKGIPTRLHHGQAPKSPYGVVQLGGDLPKRTSGVDIIFVHGLGSNPDTTWLAKANLSEESTPGRQQFINWVSDFLPEDLQASQRNIRMFFYNYDSYWKKDAVRSRLMTLGNELLEDIHGKVIISETDRRRHLIFVAHSHGGLVVKQALIQAQMSQRFLQIVDRTKAILFLGTPHRGTSIGSWGWILAQALRPLGSNPLILADLGYDGFPLQDLHRHFVHATRDDLYVFNFFEKLPTVLFQLWFFRWQQFCVQEQSATYEGKNVRNIGLSVDHYGLNKFGSRLGGYDMVKSKLVEVCERLTRSPRRYYHVPLELVDTYTERVELSQELEAKLKVQHETSEVLHAVLLQGLGGTGKSQLALRYAEEHRDRFSPILWLDAKDEESMRHSFRRCAVELQLELPKDHSAIREPVFEDPAVLAVNLWLHDRVESDEEWLVIVDNADDVSWGVRKIIPKGRRGSLIITSQDNRSVRLVNGACERVHVGLMSESEGVAVLLKHIRLDTNSASTDIQQGCSNLAKRLGLLALAIDLAGAYIGNDPNPWLALFQYLDDYERHYTELLRKDDFRGLRPTEKTVWTVWDATIERITKENTETRPDLLLTFIAQFKGGIVEEEMFRLASLGMAEVNTTLSKESIDGAQYELQQFLSSTDKGWDGFKYRQAREALVRYNLLQKVEGHGGAWPGVSMHSLVKWKANQHERDHPWPWWYEIFVLAACCQFNRESRPQFGRHLVVHLQNLSIGSINNFKDTEGFQKFAMSNLGMIYFQEGRGKEAEELLVPVRTKACTAGDSLINLQNILVVAISQRTRGQLKEAENTFKDIKETFEERLGEEHQATLQITHQLAITYVKQARFQEAEGLELRVMKTTERTLGQDSPLRLRSMANLAVIYAEMGRKKESNELFGQIAEIKERIVSLEHGDFHTLQNLSDLGTTYLAQGRLEEAEKILVQVTATSNRILGNEHPMTLSRMHLLASTYGRQSQWRRAENLFKRVVGMRKKVLGEDHPDTLESMHELATTYIRQNQWTEAESLELQVMEISKTAFGDDYPHILRTMANLALAYYGLGREKEATLMGVRAIEKGKILLGLKADDVTTEYLERSQWTKAEELGLMVVETRISMFGEEHPETLRGMHVLAFVYLNQVRLKDAEELGLLVLQKRRKVLGKKNADTLLSMDNLATTYTHQGRWRKAGKLFALAMTTSQEVFGEEDANTLKYASNLATSYMYQGRLSQAEQLLVQLLPTMRKVLGEEDPTTLGTINNLATTYHNQGRRKEAKNTLAGGLETMQRVFGEDSLSTLTARTNLAVMYVEEDEWEEAEGLLVRITKSVQTSDWKDYPSSLVGLCNLAITCMLQGRWKHGEELVVPLMKSMQSLIGEGHPQILACMENIVSTYKSSGRVEEAEKIRARMMENKETFLAI